jgi:hypothetical protein
MLRCSSERPWGLHETVRNDGDCPRCGWTAPGPVGDVREAAAEARARAAQLGWTLHDGRGGRAGDEALAA